MINWVNFLHLYQPPQQNEFIFHEVARESYFEIAKFFDLYDGIKLTMNISGSLLEQLIAYRYDKLLDDFRNAFLSGEIELVGSAIYHPILPLLPEREVERQILLDRVIKRQVFGEKYNPRGFYLSEMAYSIKVVPILEKLGFEWIILDEISFSGKLGECDTTKPYKIKDSKLKVIFRNREISNSFVPDTIEKISSEGSEKNINIITATDGELYGHRHLDFYDRTRAVFGDSNVKSLRVSEFIDSFDENDLEEIEPVASDWEAQEIEIADKKLFSYWNDGGNEIQRKMWQLAGLAIEEVEKHAGDENYKIARELLDKGLASCHFWAASGRASFLWKDTIWNPDTIENGVSFLVRSVRSLREDELKKRLEVENLFLEIIGLIWKKHWETFYKP
ncbi:MAG: hypothetical protein PHI66_02955 [Candidatus Pacebacteria bacterium]|nr:hypothetical protein [Candidatus Paceibacterota bacterium]